MYGLYVTGTAGLEPAARCLEGSYSIQLSYAPNSKLQMPAKIWLTTLLYIIVSAQCPIEQVKILQKLEGLTRKQFRALAIEMESLYAKAIRFVMAIVDCDRVFRCKFTLREALRVLA